MIKVAKTRYTDRFQFHEHDAVIGSSISHYGEYSQHEVDLLLSILNENCIVYDIGANIGYHTTAFATKARHVFAFEPNLKNFKLLCANVSDFNNVTPVNVAVMDQNAVISVEEYDPEVPGNFGNVKTGTGTGVAFAINLDSFTLIKPDLIKIDVEGNELSVLQGCENIINTYRPYVYFEAHETPNLAEIYELFEKSEYALYWCKINNFNPGNFYNEEENIFGDSALFSILAVPDANLAVGLDPVAKTDTSVEKLYERLGMSITFTGDNN